MLACPTCQHRLTRCKTDRGIVYACANCHGRSVSLGLIRRELPVDFMRTLWRQAMGEKMRRGRPCSHCRQRMSLVSFPTGDDHQLVLDVCTQCQFVWFDPKEYDELSTANAVVQSQAGLQQAQPPQLSPEAKEAAAILEVERIARAPDASMDTEPPDNWLMYLPAIFGLPVECDVPGVTRRPVITYALTALATVVYVMLAGGGEVMDAASRWGFIPADWLRHGGMTVVTSFFLHAGVWHLLSNMYFLLVFGDNVEDHMGTARFLLMIAAAHCAGLVLHSVADTQATTPLVGASGGISGVIAYYAVVFPQAKLGMFIWRVFGWIRISAIWALAGYVLLQFVGAYLQIGGFSKVSSLAHLGGLAVGLTAGLVARAKRQPDA